MHYHHNNITNMTTRLLVFTLVLATLPYHAEAWTGPTAAPPGNNVYAPINVSGAEQFKPGIIGANMLNIYGSSQYLNFGNTTGAAGFGLRNNTGVLEFKNSGGTWTSLLLLSKWAQSGSDIHYSAGNVGVATSSPLAKLTVGGASGYANNVYYDIGADRIAANTSIYSYGRLCAGNSSGNCLGTGGTVVRNDGIQFPDGTIKTTARTLGDWSLKAANAVHQAATDGFVTFSIGGTGITNDQAILCTGSNLALVTECYGTDGSQPGSATMKSRAYNYNGGGAPVKKGDYWQVQYFDYLGDGGSVLVNWIPFAG